MNPVDEIAKNNNHGHMYVCVCKHEYVIVACVRMCVCVFGGVLQFAKSVGRPNAKKCLNACMHIKNTHAYNNCVVSHKK